MDDLVEVATKSESKDAWDKFRESSIYQICISDKNRMESSLKLAFIQGRMSAHLGDKYAK